MALSKQKKDEIVADVSNLLANSKLTVVAKYQGTTVQAIQTLRKDARESGTNVRVIKNRLVVQSLKAQDSLKDVDTSALSGMLLYAFNSEDEVAPAKDLDAFAKTNPTIEFVGAITADGQFISSDEVKALAKLPSKAQLIAGVINILNSPLRGVVSGLQGNLHGLLDAVAAKATN